MKKITCLPIAGLGNPYQHLMMEGLEKAGLQVGHGSPGKIFALIKTAIRLQPDYIHLDWLHQYYLRRAAWMTWINFPIFALELFIVRYLLGVKLVWTLHNITPHDHPYYGPHKWSRQLFGRQCSWIRVFHASSVTRASQLLRFNPAKFKVIPEGSYVGYYPNELSRETARQQLQLAEKSKVALYLGLVKPYKGVLELMEAFSRLSIPNAELLVGGKAMQEDYKNQLSAVQHPHIHWEDRFIPEEELQLYFNAADVVVLPFKKIENSGSVILAMSFGKAVVAPRKGVLEERLKQQSDFLYEEEDLEPMLKKALSLSIEELATIGQKNLLAVEQHRWEDVATCFA